MSVRLVGVSDWEVMIDAVMHTGSEHEVVVPFGVCLVFVELREAKANSSLDTASRLQGD